MTCRTVSPMQRLAGLLFLGFFFFSLLALLSPPGGGQVERRGTCLYGVKIVDYPLNEPSQGWSSVCLYMDVGDVCTVGHDRLEHG